MNVHIQNDSMLSESEKFKSCIIDKIPQIVKFYTDTFDDLNLIQQSRSICDYRFNSTYMSSMVAEKIQTVFRYKAQKMKFGVVSLNVENEYRVLFKKLNNSSMPSYNHTKNSLSLINQQYTLDLPSSQIIYIGYKVNHNWQKITEINAVYICEKQVYWTLDLMKIANQIERLTDQINVINKEDIKVEVKVKAKNQNLKLG